MRKFPTFDLYACIHYCILQRCTLILFAGMLHTGAWAQDEWRNLDPAWLQEVLPLADHFSPRQGDPPVYVAYASSPEGSEADLIGYAFTTPDLPPEEIGFSAPIDLLVGMYLSGTISGVKVLYYIESYKYIRGDFIGNSDFLDWFTNKSVGDEFRVNRDIDGMSRATITSWAMARAVRNSLRRVASAYLPELEFVIDREQEFSALQWLREQSWQELIEKAYVRRFSIASETTGDFNFSIAFMGHGEVGKILLGARDYSSLEEELLRREADGYVMLIGLDGNPLQLWDEHLAVIQNGAIYPNPPFSLVFAGTAQDGKIAGQAGRSLAMQIHPEIDISQPFELVYDTGTVKGEFREYVGTEYAVAPELLSLLLGASQLDLEPEQSANLNPSALQFDEVIRWIFVILALILSVFAVRKNPRGKTR